jgi:hypothetical protein
VLTTEDGYVHEVGAADRRHPGDPEVHPQPREMSVMSEQEKQSGDGEVGVCHVCGKTFASQELLSRHLLEEHADQG